MNCEKLVDDNKKLIWKIAGYFYGVPKNDLFQAGVVGLLKALKNYRNDGKTKFSTYAHDYIFGEMYNLASDKEIKISKDVLRLYKKIEVSRYNLAQKIGKIPTNLELSRFLEIPLEDIEIACQSAISIMSLDTELEGERSFYESIPAANENVDAKILIDESLSVLDEEEKNIIKSRYFEDLTQTEVARKLNMTQVMVSRYEKRGINKMRQYLTL